MTDQFMYQWILKTTEDPGQLSHHWHAIRYLPATRILVAENGTF
jgi:hypothetical protein